MITFILVSHLMSYCFDISNAGLHYFLRICCLINLCLNKSISNTIGKWLYDGNHTSSGVITL